MKESPICFGPNDNHLNSSFIVPYSGTLAAVKLVHAYGYVKCHDSLRTFWGCRGNSKEYVKVVIRKATDDNNNIIFPSTTFFKKEGQKDSFRIPGYNALSAELVLSDLSYPPNVSVTGGQKLRLSYLGAPEAGTTCCDVYARFR